MNKKTIFALLLCLALFASLSAFPAFAADTMIIIGGSVANPNAASSNASDVVLSGGSGTIVSDGAVNSAASSSGTVSAGSVVVVMPNGTSQSVPQSASQTQTQTQTIVGGQGVQPSSTQTAAASGAVVVQEQNSSAQTTTSVQAPAGLATELLALINQNRAANGLSTLKYSEALQEAADTRAKESVTNFSHIRPDGSGCETAVTVDYMVTGENLIQVTSEFATAAIMVDTWMNSPTHRNNILLKDFSEMAVGTYVANGTTYVSTVFAGY